MGVGGGGGFYRVLTESSKCCNTASALTPEDGPRLIKIWVVEEVFIDYTIESRLVSAPSATYVSKSGVNKAK